MNTQNETVDTFVFPGTRTQSTTTQTTTTTTTVKKTNRPSVDALQFEAVDGQASQSGASAYSSGKGISPALVIVILIVILGIFVAVKSKKKTS